MHRAVRILLCAALLPLVAGCRHPEPRATIPAFPAPDSLPFLPPSARSFLLVRSANRIEMLCGQRLGEVGWVANRGSRQEAKVTEHIGAGAQGDFDRLVAELEGRTDARRTWDVIHGHRVLHRRLEPGAERGTSPWQSWTGYEWITRVDRFVIQADTRELMTECLGPGALELGELPRHVGISWRVDWSADAVVLRDATAPVSDHQSWTYPGPRDDSVRTVTFALFGRGAGARFEFRAATVAPRAVREAIEGLLPVEEVPPIVEHDRDGVLSVMGRLKADGDGRDARCWFGIGLTYGVLYVI